MTSPQDVALEELLRIEFWRDAFGRMDDPLEFCAHEMMQIVSRGDRPVDVNLLARNARRIVITISAEQ